MSDRISGGVHRAGRSSKQDMPNTSRSGRTRVRKKETDKSGQANDSSSDEPAARKSTSVAQRIPFDVIKLILAHYATLSPSCALNSLLVSKHLTSSVEKDAYRSVSIFSVRGLEVFQQLLKQHAHIGRYVKALWVAPGRSDSDLIHALAPPTSNAALEARQRKIQSLAREVLRNCRRLEHLALDGGFLTPQCAIGFGTACKPTSLLCVNPHSFLGHFSAPIFRSTVRRLEVVDTTLAVEEVDEIRQMHALRQFIWTAPRANSDVTRDVSVLLRILSPRSRDITAAATAAAAAAENGQPAIAVAAEQDMQLVQLLTNSGNALPEKARMNADLRSICTATSQARASALAASFKKIVESVELAEEDDFEIGQGIGNNGGDDMDNEEDRDLVRAMRAMKAGFYVDSSRANSSSLHKPTGVELQTQALSSLMHALSMQEAKRKGGEKREKDGKEQEAEEQEKRAKGDDDDDDNDDDDGDDDDDDDDDDEVVDEWEALRDVVCQRRTTNSTSSSRFFAGLGSGVSTPGWAMSRAASPSPSSRTPGSSTAGMTTANSPGTATPNNRYEEEIDGGRALQRVWQRWRQQFERGDLNVS